MPALHQRMIWMPSPPLAPDDGALDRDHLGRATLGQRDLEREVLTLFLTQVARVMNMLEGLGADSATLAHTLKGAALGIGAFGVADAARRFEEAVRAGDVAALPPALGALQQAVADAREAIAQRQQEP